jgi:hypothetical protein
MNNVILEPRDEKHHQACTSSAAKLGVVYPNPALGNGVHPLTPNQHRRIRESLQGCLPHLCQSMHRGLICSLALPVWQDKKSKWRVLTTQLQRDVTLIDFACSRHSQLSSLRVSIAFNLAMESGRTAAVAAALDVDRAKSATTHYLTWPYKLHPNQSKLSLRQMLELFPDTESPTVATTMVCTKI